MEEDKTKNKEVLVACTKCDGETYHKIMKSVDTLDSGDWGTFWSDYEIIMCQGCHTLSFRMAWGSDDIVGTDDDGLEVYDKNDELFPSRIKGRRQLRYYEYLPSKIRNIYSETHQAISSKQPILTGIGIRSLVEAVCTEKNTIGADLKEKIDALVRIGFLTPEGAQILHQTRIHGNEAVHEAIPIKDKDLGILMDIAENLLENTYILPKKASDLRKEKR